MRSLLIAFAALFISVSAHAHVSAVPFPEIGSLQDVTPAALGTVGGRASGDEPAITTCNAVTGVATGLDAGTCMTTLAVCDGTTPNQTAFTSFNTWAKATTTNTNGGLIELYIPTTSGTSCNFTSGNAATFTGLKKARLMAYGITFKGNNQPSLGTGGVAGSAGICHRGLNDAAGCSARINTVSAGATSVNINTNSYGGSLTTLCGRFTATRWVVITGFDLQGGYDAPYGYPPNPQYFDYAQIVSTTNCAATGEITLSRPLTFGYLSTWPNFNTGSGGEADQGGPGTIYQEDSSWGGEIDIRGVTIDSTLQAFYISRSVTLRDVTMTGSGTVCVIPTQSDTFTMINSVGANCDIEVDKIVNNLTYTGTTLKRLSFQSASTNTLNWSGGSLTTDMNGTAKIANISNLTTPIMTLGPYAFGTPTSATCTNCVVSNTITGFGLVEKGTNDIGANNFYTISSGVFSFPLKANVTNMVANPSGKLRLTVDDSTGWADGAVSGKSGLFSACSVPCTGGLVIDVVSVGAPGTIDVTNFNFADITWSGSGFLYNTAEQLRWAVPGTNVSASSVGGVSAGVPFFQVTSVTQSGNFVNIATTLPSGYPNVPLSGGESNLIVQAPKWTCTNCSGTPQMVDFSGAPPNTPIFSYSNRTWSCTGGPPCTNTTLTNYPLWGKVSSFKINVTQAYTGATNPMRYQFTDVGVSSAGVFASFNGFINLRQPGLRTITPAGVTCDTGGGPVGGACSGDTGLTLTDPNIMLGANMTPARPDGSPTDANYSINAEFILDQGVVP